MLKTIDLFAGAGGLSYGFEATGEFVMIAAVENNKDARKTYIENHKGNQNIIMIPDVREYDFISLAEKYQGIDVVIGGPPCQGFSNANRQKNHIINMNNSLVKEYFRAIKQIKPKAFVMENVSMLSSDTHRFYDSIRDHDIVTELGVVMRTDELVISESDYGGINLGEIFDNQEENGYRISDDLFKLLNVLYKNRNNEERLSKYKRKYCNRIVSEIERNIEILAYNFTILERVIHMLVNIENENCLEELGQFIKFQKSFRLKEELDFNEIIYDLNRNPITGRIVARVESYSVIDYVNKILGKEYVKNNGVVNSLWFGVPQERKRFIMMGVRADIMKEKEIVLPTENDDKRVTVGEAIGDLIEYPVNEDNIDPDIILYYPSEHLSEYAILMREGSEGIRNHIVPKNKEKVKERFAALGEGENFHKLSAELKDNYANPTRTQNSIYLRLDSSKPSGTVVNVRKSMWIHPSLNRAISVREAARLQSFPDNFVFKGTKDAQYQQIGNAVPPLMAKGIAKELLKYL